MPVIQRMFILALAGVASLQAFVMAEASRKELVYEGTWKTTNRRLDGRMTCIVTETGDKRWAGHFYGVWQGVEFSYNVNFSGPPDKLTGTAVIDGADYTWTGEISRDNPGRFQGTFDGSRYRGSFDLKQQPFVRTHNR